MKPRQHRTRGIILARTNFGEADRILTLITPDQGKIKAMAKAVRRQKSKLAGGIELFSVSDISYVQGRGDIATLTSTRLLKHYGNIVKDLERTSAGFEFIKSLDRVTAESTSSDYFDLLRNAFEALDDARINLDTIRLWFIAQLIRLSGHTPNLLTDRAGKKLSATNTYDFNIDEMAFTAPPGRNGSFQADHIKFLRLVFDGHRPKSLQRIEDSNQLAATLLGPVQAIFQAHVR